MNTCICVCTNVCTTILFSIHVCTVRTNNSFHFDKYLLSYDLTAEIGVCRDSCGGAIEFLPTLFAEHRRVKAMWTRMTLPIATDGPFVC